MRLTKLALRQLLLRLLLLTAIVITSLMLLTCDKVPDYCGKGELYDPTCAFCYGSQPYLLCVNEKREYNPLTGGCDADGRVGTRCADGSAVPLNTPCGGYMVSVAVLPKGVDDIRVDSDSENKTNFTANENLSLYAVSTNDDYEFAGWGGDAASTDRTNRRLTYKMSGSKPQVTIVAMFKPKGEDVEYTLSASAYPEEGGYIIRNREPDVGTGKYNHGDMVRLTAVGNSGYVFDGWTGSVQTSNDQPAIDIEMTETKALVAMFVPTVRTLRASASPSDGGAVYINSASVSGGESREVGTEVVVFARAWEGYAFSRWSSGTGVRFENDREANTTVTLAANAEITAQFTRDGGGTVAPPQTAMTYTLTTNAQPIGGGTVSRSPNVDNYNSGARVTVTASESKGYRFTGWSGAVVSESANQSVILTMDGNKELTAKFEAISTNTQYYSLMTYANPTIGGTVSRYPEASSYSEGTTVTVTASAASGYSFVNWLGASSSSNPQIQVTMSMGLTLTANFTQDKDLPTYSVIYNGNGNTGGTVPTDTVKYLNGAVVTVLDAGTLTRTKYKFDGWNTMTNGNGIGYPTNSTLKIDGKDITLYAKWVSDTIPTYAVIVTGGQAGKNSYMADSIVTITANILVDSLFNSWTSSSGVTFANANSATTTFTMPANDVTVTANFTPTYTITFNANSGTVSPTSGTTGTNGKLTTSLPTPTRSNYTFNGWFTATTGGTQVSTSTVFTSNATIYAQWTYYNIKKGQFTDSRDGKEYDSVRIGTQTWMAENLNYETSSGSWCYGNSADSCNKYGRLYDWKTAMNGASSSSANPSKVQGVCPNNWHLPSRAEWNTLANYVGGSSVAGQKLKATSGWYNNGNGTDEYGFSALPGGRRYYSDGSFDDVGNNGYWWTATENDSDLAYYRYMNYDVDYLNDYGSIKDYGFSVRCVGD